MNYGADVRNIRAHDAKGKALNLETLNDNTWRLTGNSKKGAVIEYDIHTSKQFVANSYVDTARAYLIPGNSFLYIDRNLQLPATVQITMNPRWDRIATGLQALPKASNRFLAKDFDELYDNPILIGNLEELPSFTVKGKSHRFIALKPGTFDRPSFVARLQKMIEAATDLFGDIPYTEYTFIGIGPGRGGIEHTNNTTVSFDGSGLGTARGMNTMLNFLTHEYVHHFNIKRIRPVELGPFDYDKENRTNQLWISEGLSVYYEYIVMKQAGLADAATFLANLEGDLNAHESNPGRLHQSLQQASYNTWKDGPFGTQREEKGKTISYYDKGPLVGMLLDLNIRQASANKHSLDDVMRFLYVHYYKELQRGFTEAEFQEACEQAAGIPLNSFFDYVYTAKELDYDTYLGYAGLQLDRSGEHIRIKRMANITASQERIYKGWARE